MNKVSNPEAFCYDNGMLNAFEKKLPATYSFDYKEGLLPEEIISLRESVGWKGDEPSRWERVIKQSLFTVGVRNSEGKLVGMASLAGNVRHAVMCDLCVNPNDQNKGIGEAIMHQLYEAVAALNIRYVYAELSKANPFKAKMVLSGFKETGDSLFWNIYD
jgi:ribosomal protein S18 acetylase RimI-like enzyme